MNSSKRRVVGGPNPILLKAFWTSGMKKNILALGLSKQSGEATIAAEIGADIVVFTKQGEPYGSSNFSFSPGVFMGDRHRSLPGGR
jgi:hypothetical protein